MALEGAVNIVLSSTLWLILTLKTKTNHTSEVSEVSCQKKTYAESKGQHISLSIIRSHIVGFFFFLHFKWQFGIYSEFSKMVTTGLNKLRIYQV